MSEEKDLNKISEIENKDAKDIEDTENKEDIEESLELDEAAGETSGIEKEKDIVSLMGWYIRDKSYEGKACNAEEFLEEPFSLEIDEIFNNLEELKAREEFEDIYSLKGKSVLYLFSEKYVTHNYAEMLVMTEEEDLPKIIAENVRKESKIYPRPTPVKLFSFKPFSFSKEEIQEALRKLKDREEFSDIKELKTSNGVLYLYSEKYMKKAHAASLAEWVEVERRSNP